MTLLCPTWVALNSLTTDKLEPSDRNELRKTRRKASRSKEKTNNISWSTHIWSRVQELGPGHINGRQGRRMLSPLRHPRYLVISQHFVRFLPNNKRFPSLRSRRLSNIGSASLHNRRLSVGWARSSTTSAKRENTRGEKIALSIFSPRVFSRFALTQRSSACFAG